MGVTSKGVATPARAAERRALFCHLLGRQLNRVLRLVDVEEGGQAVRPDAFARGTAEPRVPATPRLRYETLLSYARNEPRLELMSKSLTRALRLGQFVAEGRAVAVDGFRLRDLAQWARYPAPSLEDNIGSISSYCTCDCEFCYEKGTRGAGIVLGHAQLSRRELETRIRWYSAEKKTGLVPSSRFALEAFANPRCLEILERMRAVAPDQGFSITTNGARLTEEVVARLAGLRPIFVTVSMNASTVDLRLKTMRDRKREHAETALACPALLRKYDIPFHGSYVPWPSKPLSDMEEMIRLLDRNDAVGARVCLPSWTRFSAQEAPFDTDSYWREIHERVMRLRREVSIPIHVVPNLYEMPSVRPIVQGTVKGSPAAEAGLRYGDLILTVGEASVYTRPQTIALLGDRFRDPSIQETRVVFERSGERREVVLPHCRDREALPYPYRCLVCDGGSGARSGGLGIYLTDGLTLSSLMGLKEVVEENAGKRVLLLVSELGMAPFYEAMGLLGEEIAFLDRAEVHVARLRPSHWGGNVIIGDLWTTNDIVRRTREWIRQEGARPDLVVVPTSFLSLGGRDLLGQSWLEAERALDIEIRLLPCLRIMT